MYLKNIVCAGLFALVLPATAIAQPTATQVPQAVAAIDVNKYMGKWYEIARLPMYFQRKCVADTTAMYTLNTDNTIRVNNSCRTASGDIESAEGVATPVNEGKSKLKVSFLPAALRWIPFTKGDYWVLKIDPDYHTVLVGGPTHDYLWILSRTPVIDAATYAAMLETAQHYGYDTSALINTTHDKQ